jgi:hypothetical protein
MQSFVYLRDELSRPLTSAFFVPGYHFQEAFSVSEAVWICTQQHLGIVIIADNFQDSETEQLERRYISRRLKPETTAEELLGELELMLYERPAAAS